MSQCRGENDNPVVIIQGGVDVTLTASQQLVAAGTVQVSPNSEVSTGVIAANVQQTKYIVPPTSP